MAISKTCAGHELEAFSIEPAQSMRDVNYAFDLADAEGWSPGERDGECLYTLNPEGFLMVKLSGRAIGCVVVFKFNSSHAYIWMFVLEKPNRGKGLGSKAFAHALDHLTKNGFNISLDAVEDRIPFYQRMGFNPAWKAARYEFGANFLAHKLFDIVQPTSIVPLDEIDFQALAEYDESIFGETRRKWLEVWISQPDALGKAALDQRGKIVGYVAVQTAIATKPANVAKVVRVRPLLADSVDIALCLLQSVVESILHSCSLTSSQLDVLILADIPIEANQNAAQMCQQLGGQVKYSFVKMFTTGSKQAMQKVFVNFP